MVAEVEAEPLVALADPFVAIETQEVVVQEVAVEEIVVVAASEMTGSSNLDHLPFQLTFEILAAPNVVAVAEAQY